MPVEPQDIENAQLVLLEADATSKEPALDSKELLRRVLEFANTGNPKGLPGGREMEYGGKTFYMDSSDEHATLRKDLAAIIAGELATPAVARLLKQSRHATVQTFELDRQGKLVHKERHFVPNLATLIAGQLMLIHSEERLRDDVKQCRLLGCGRFFLASDDVKDPSAPGRRRHRYCSPEHMDLAQSTGAERTRKWREDKAKKLAKASASPKRRQERAR
jgi:hypothetical protein